MDDESPLNSALRQFEAVEANLVKLEGLWSDEIRPAISTGVAFHGDTPEYDRSCRQFRLLIDALPAIDRWKPDALPMELNAIGQNRFDALEVGEIDAQVAIEDAINEPIRQIREYRFRFDETRRKLIRDSLVERIDSIDARLRVLAQLIQPAQDGNAKVSGPDWEGLKEDVAQIDSLLGSSVARPPRWGDLHRHLRFAAGGDLFDILNSDWPAAKEGLRKSLYGEKEPIPVGVKDLSSLVAARPKGAVATKLQWDQLSEEDFERLLFALISSEEGYVNPQWLTKTNAADRGRDLSVIRVHVDPLSGTTNSRVIIQCKHWLGKSIAPPDVSTLAAQMSLWEPPRVDVVVIATSGRFTSDAVSFIEKHNLSDRALRVEMWPESHLERLLAKRPAIIAQFKLR